MAVPLQAFESEPFKMVVATPTLPNTLPGYLTSNGTVASLKGDAAICYTAKERLFCGGHQPVANLPTKVNENSGSQTPIGASKDAAISQLKPSTDPDALTTILGIKEGTNEITWQYSGSPSTLPPGMFEPAVMKSACRYPLKHTRTPLIE